MTTDEAVIAAESALVEASMHYGYVANCHPDNEPMNDDAFEDLDDARECFAVAWILQQAADLRAGGAWYSALSDSAEAAAYLDALRTIVASIEAAA